MFIKVSYDHANTPNIACGADVQQLGRGSKLAVIHASDSYLNWQKIDHRNQLIQRHKATERACETRPHNLNIVRTANKRELDVNINICCCCC